MSRFEELEATFSTETYSHDELRARRHDARVARFSGIRRGVALLAISSVIAGGVAVNYAREHFGNNIVCHTDDPKNPRFYTADTATEAAQQIPGVYEDNLDLRDIPMQTTPTAKPKYAANIDYVITGVYGPDECHAS